MAANDTYHLGLLKRHLDSKMDEFDSDAYGEFADEFREVTDFWLNQYYNIVLRNPQIQALHQ